MHKHKMRSLEHKFSHSQVVLSAHLEHFSNFPSLKTLNTDNIFNYSGRISSFVGVYESLSYDSDLSSAALLNTAVQKLPLNMKKSWSHYTVKENTVNTSLLDFNGWFEEESKTHILMKNTFFKTQNEDTVNSVTSTRVASKAIAANTQQKNHRKPQQIFGQYQSLVALHANLGIGCKNAVS